MTSSLFSRTGNICAGGATTGCPNCASNILLSLGCSIEIPTACYSAGWRAVLIIGGSKFRIARALRQFMALKGWFTCNGSILFIGAATPLRASAMPQPAIPLEQVFLCRERTSARGGETGRAPQKAPACRWRLRDFRLDGILFILRKS